MMRQRHDEKPYSIMWIEAERRLALMGLLPHAFKPAPSPRIRHDKLPTAVPPVPGRLLLPK